MPQNANGSLAQNAGGTYTMRGENITARTVTTLLGYQANPESVSSRHGYPRRPKSGVYPVHIRQCLV